MKYLTLGCVIGLLITSCSSPKSKTAGTDTLANNDTLAKAKDTTINNNKAAVSSLCFLNTQGKDSTSVELVIRGNQVTGQMNWLPYQKDSRKGTLAGTVNDDAIHAVWSFMQEGMMDTLNLNFQLKGGQLSQKPLKLNTKTGREQTDGSAGYSIIYNSSNKLHSH